MTLSRFRAWIRKTMGVRPIRPAKGPRNRRAFIQLESLDDRLTPSAVTWTGAGDGTTWSLASNWSTDAVPGADDDVTINTSDTVTLSGTVTVNSLTMSGGSLDVSGSLTTGQGLTLDNTFATIDNTGTVTVDGALNWTDGTISGAGTTILNGSANLSGGFFSMLDNQQIDNYGSTTIATGNSIDFEGGAVWNNEAGATFTLEGTGSLGTFFASSSAAFNNFGTVETEAPAGTASIGVAFNNSGTVDVQSGTLNLSSGGAGSGAFTIDSGAILSTSNYTLDNATVSGAGTLQVSSLTASGTSSIQNLTVTGGTVVNDGDLSVGDLTLTGGTFTNNDSLTVQDLTLSNTFATLSNVGTLTVDDSFTWTDGTLSGTGTTILDGASSLSGGFFSKLTNQLVENYGAATITNGNSIDFDGNTIWDNEAGSTFTLDGTGSIGNFFASATSAFNNFGEMDVNSPGASTSFSVPFNNTGTVDVQAGTLSLGSGGVGGGTFTIAAGAILSLNNYTLQDATVTGGGTVTANSLTVTGASSIETLTITGGNNQIDSSLDGQTLLVTGGSVKAEAELDYQSLTMKGGSVTAEATLEFQSLTMNGGTLTAEAGFQGQGLFVSSGTVTVDGTASVQDLTVSGGSLTGPATLTINDNFVWSAGSFGVGEAILNGTSTITGSFFSPLTGEVENYGTAAIVTGSSVTFEDNAVWNNELGSTLILPDSASLSPFFSSGSALNNYGTLEVTAPAGSSTIGIPLNNSGTVDVQAGTLTLSGGGIGNGAFTIEAGAMLDTQSYTLDGATITGDGVVQVGSFSTLSVTGSSSVENLSLTGGTLDNTASLEVQNLTLANVFSTIDNTGTLTVDDSFTWTDGNLSGVGVTILNGVSNLSGGFFSMLTNQTIDNYGTATISNGNSIDFEDNAVWNNEAGGSLLLQSSGGIGNIFASASSIVNNAGLIEVEAPTGTSAIGVPVNNSGTVDVANGVFRVQGAFTNSGEVTVAVGSAIDSEGYTQTAGDTEVNGTLQSPTTVIDGGSLTGSGVVDANVTNSGEVAPGDGPAVLTINGSYTQTSTGDLAIQIDGTTAGSGYSQLVVTGAASLAGSLTVTDPNNFLPDGGDTFEAIAFASSTGNFDAYNGLNLGNGAILQPSFAPNDAGVDLVTYITTTTSLTSNPADNASVYGQDVTFTATVSAADGSTPEGTVQFEINGADAGGPISLVNGTATLDAGTPPAGSYQVVAVYSGEGFNLGDTSSTLDYTVNPDPTTTTLSASPAITAVGQSVTFTATISADAPGSGTPTGSVSFYDGGTLLATVNLPPGGPDQVSFTTSALGVGTHSIAAAYSGDGNFVASTSAASTETILGPGVAVFGSSVYVVGADTSDYVQISPVGSSATGSTGVQVNSTLDGAWSSRTISQPVTAVYVFGDNGNDTIQLASSLTVDAFITEGNGNDYIQTAGGNDVITLGSGSDQVFGGNGNKTVTAQDAPGSADYIQLGGGNDVVSLGQGNDQVVLGGGDNTVTAGNGNDAVTTGNGNNSITLGNGNEYISTGNGNDDIVVGNGAVTLLTGNGNKTITAGNGNDYVRAGTGANLITLGNGNDNVQLGNGNNSVTLGNGTDYLSAGSGNNVISVGNGNNDDVQVGAGNNVIVAGSGVGDYISAGNGDNLVAAGTGEHTVNLGNGSNILIDGSVTLTQPGDSLTQVLADWIAGGDSATNVASIRSRLAVTYNESYNNYLGAGDGLDWFWFAYVGDQTNMKPTDLYN